ncbi:MAG: GxxExxY protein [Verrucomicrobia bacterium]|nr:GxxExxY protein [Verrucomicrobiota bacterium]
MKLIFEEQTRILRRCLFDVHNEVGVGYPEAAYHRAFLACCQRRGVPLLSRQKGRLCHRDVVVHVFEYDVLAWEMVMLELKALSGGFARDHFVQILTYLKFWKKRLGLLVNFGKEKVRIERLPFAEKELVVSENYAYIKPRLATSDRPLLRAIREGILTVAQTHGLGYGDTLCAKLLCAEWHYRQLAVHNELRSPARFEEVELGRFPIDGLLVGERVLCCVTALKEDIGPYEIGKAQSYLRALDLTVALVVNFGKRALQIRGICAPRR